MDQKWRFSSNFQGQSLTVPGKLRRYVPFRGLAIFPLIFYQGIFIFRACSMRIYLFCLFSIVSPSLAHGQELELGVIVGKNKQPLSMGYDLAEQFELERLESSLHDYHMRLWGFEQFVEVWESESSGVNGFVLNWTEALMDKKSESVILYKIDTLSLEASTSLKKLTESYDLEKMLRGFEIDHEMIFLHGVEYDISFVAEDTVFSHVSFVRGAVSEVFSSLVEEIETVAETKEKRLQFGLLLPFDCYLIGPVISACKELSFSERRANRRSRRKYDRRVRELITSNK